MRKTITAITRRGNTYRAVVLSKKGEAYDVRFRSRESGASSWDALRAEIWNSGGSGGSSSDGLVVGYDSNRVAYYRLSVPAVKGEELEKLVELQSEALLPLPRDEMDVAWRGGAEQNGKIGVTIAATRRGLVEQFKSEVQKCDPQKILLAGEALVKAWQMLCQPVPENAAVVYLTESSTQVCIVADGQLGQSITLDVGKKDLVGTKGLHEPNAERVAQDIQSSLKRFGNGSVGDWDIYMLTEGSELTEKMAVYLEGGGLRIHRSSVPLEKFKSDTELAPEEIYESLVPIGLALKGLDEHDEALNLFSRIEKVEKTETKKQRISPLLINGVLALVMVLLLPWALMEIDNVRLNNIESYILKVKDDVDKLKGENKLKMAIEKQRADVLSLWTSINECKPEGELLDGIDFKKGTPVTITGHTKNKDKILEFQENLEKHDEIKTVRVLDRKMDAKTKAINYTISFEYGDLSKKGKK